MKSLNIFPSLFFTRNPDALKEFNDQLSKKIIKEMDAAYPLLSSGKTEEYVGAINSIIANNFPTKTKVTLGDILQDANLTQSLEKDLACDVTNISEPFATDQNAIPVLNIVFPETVSAANCFPIQPFPLAHSINIPEQTSYTSNFNRLFAEIATEKPTSEFLDCAIANPPQINSSWVMSFDESNFRCAIPPFIQNYILSSDRLAVAGEEQHFIFSNPSTNSTETPSFLHYVGAASIPNRPATLAFVNRIGGNEMTFINSISFAPYIILHETLHWLGLRHPHEVPVVNEFLGEWAIKTGDPTPSISSYPYITIGNSEDLGGLLQNQFISPDDGDISHSTLSASDTNHCYLRPYDALILKALQHRRLICMTERKEAGYVVDAKDISRSIGQACATSHVAELEAHNFNTLSTSSQKILAHSLKRITGIEVPIILSEALLTAYKTDDPEQSNLRKLITSENGINGIKTILRTLTSLITMGVTPTAASLILQGAIPLSAGICQDISVMSGFSNSEVAKRLEQTSEYISNHVPETIRKNLFGVAMIYALHNIQYSEYSGGYIRNFDTNFNFVPRTSISATEAVIVSCVVAVISTALSSSLKYGIEKLKESPRKKENSDSPKTALETSVATQLRPKKPKNLS